MPPWPLTSTSNVEKMLEDYDYFNSDADIVQDITPEERGKEMQIEDAQLAGSMQEYIHTEHDAAERAVANRSTGCTTATASAT